MSTTVDPSGWQLVTIGTAEINIDPTGLILFPRHCSPDQVPDYLAALAQAGEIAETVRNQPPAPSPPGLPTNKAIVTQGPPPAGTTQLPQQHRAAIGRPR